MNLVAGSPAIPVNYFLRIPNFGDRLGPEIVEAVSGRQAVWCRDQRQPHILAIGSMMAGASLESQVWGTGVMHPRFGFGAVQGARIHALRGQLSMSALKAAGIALGDVPLGDPAVLAPSLLGIRACKVPQYRVGVVAHYVDRQHPVLRAMSQEEGVCDINVHDDPMVVLAAMANCEAIISSSLHGLVVAEALGLPNLWIQASDEIAGDGFKFNDWYSTTRRPQKQVYRLQAGDRAHELAARAEPRESAIDTEALFAAFPCDVEWGGLTGKTWLPIQQCRLAPMPVILISFNRGAMLRRMIDGLLQLARPVEIIIHDNGSDDAVTLRILLQLELEGIAVYRHAAILFADELNQVNATVLKHFADWAEPSAYVVSDCDIDISVADSDVLDVYQLLLNVDRRAECVGPMLRIHDIPEAYPLRNRALNRHIEQFWRHLPVFIAVETRMIAVQQAQIDTSFAMHRPGETFRRLKPGLRVYEPYEALHLDWYIRPEQAVADEQMYAQTSSAGISHWNNAAETTLHGHDELEHRHFHTVCYNKNGDLKIDIVHLDRY